MTHEEAGRADRQVVDASTQEVLVRLARIEERLAAGDQRFEEFAKHVEDCTHEKRSLQAVVSELKGMVDQMDTSIAGIRVLVFGMLGAVVLTGGGMIAALFRMATMLQQAAGG